MWFSMTTFHIRQCHVTHCYFYGDFLYHIVAYTYRLKVTLVWELTSITQQNSYKKSLNGVDSTPSPP